ncbi:MAG: HDOD domain-containing protein [Chromatiales bacterium]|nr:HDOD domain-containing protein [Chromatiales bacterium]
MIELPNLDLLLDSDPEMMTLPSIVHEILELIDSSDSSSEEIVKLVSQDAVLTTKVLRMVNSAYYGLVAQIETVAHAINIIGLRTLRDIVVVTKVGEKFNGVSPDVVNVESFWENNLACAGMAKRLDQRQLIPRNNIFAPALLSNIGVLVMLQKSPRASRHVLQAAKENRQNIYDVEQEILGYTHADISVELMKRWEIPEIFIQVAKYRHHFYEGGSYSNEAAIVHLAASYTDRVQPFVNFEGLNSEPDLAIHNYINLPEIVIHEVMDEMDGGSTPSIMM